jgi:hypothetical protein
MRYRISKSRTGRVRLPSLIGGINACNDSTAVADNQLSDGINVIAEDGNLRTRPALVSSENSVKSINGEILKIKRTDMVFPNGAKMVAVWYIYGIAFYECFANGTLSEKGKIEINGEIVNEWSALYNGDIYSFVTYKDSVTEEAVYKIYKNFELVGDNDVYTPLVFTNCRSNGSLTPAINGDSIEGYNLIGDGYKIQWTAFNAELGKEAYPATYSLIHIPPIDSTVTVEIIHDDGKTVTHTVTINSNTETCYEKNINGNDGIKVGILGKRVAFYGESNGEDKILLVCAKMPENTTEGYFANNVKSGITITARYEGNISERQQIFSATNARWFGGNGGLISGTRLFISGFEGEFSNLLQWSGLNDPTYFPSDCNSEVGEKNDPITHIDKQSDMLVIFKKYSLYFSKYSQGDIDGASNNAALDLSVATATFPLVQIPGIMGCDCPDTVRLCANRLVWLNSNGMVYTLVSTSQYNERSIYEVSGPINNILKCFSADELKKASACEYGGYYVLCIGKRMLFMDYTSYGYRYIYSYKNEEAAETKLPWFYIEGPEVFEKVIEADGNLNCFKVLEKNRLVCYSANKNVYKDKIAVIDSEDNLTFEDKKIHTMLQSKIFDFNYPETYKKVCSVLAEVGNTEGDAVKISYITDRTKVFEIVDEINYQESEILIRLKRELSDESGKFFNPEIGYSEAELKLSVDDASVHSSFVTLNGITTALPGYFNNIRHYPQLNFIKKFAIKFECDGVFSLGSISVNYKTLGSVK